MAARYEKAQGMKQCPTRIGESLDPNGPGKPLLEVGLELLGIWCRRRDLNPHGFRHTPLKRACLPFHHFGPKKERPTDELTEGRRIIGGG
jgi:hypothetical protein